MLHALLQVSLLLALLAIARWAPWGVIVPAVVIPLGLYGLLANRTRPHRVGGSRVLVTGASTGLGRAIALEAARRGASMLILVARGEEALNEVAQQVTELAPRCEPLVFPCDVANRQAVAALADTLVNAQAVPDIVVNNAGAGAWLHLEETEPGEVDSLLAVPATAAIQVSRALVPAMSERGTGHIVNVTSAVSLTGLRGAVVYGTARWAVRGLSWQLRADLSELGLGTTLLNASEVTGTAYFADRPGKAGRSSRARIPNLFGLGWIRALSYDADQTANATWNAVERGTFEAFVPMRLMGPVAFFNRLVPDLIFALLQIGPAGRRRR